jgi:hypothetical protein
MAEITRLYLECRTIHGLLRRMPGGHYSHSGANRAIINAYLGPIKAMSLYTHENPQLERILLLLSHDKDVPAGGEGGIMVYADPSKWPHKKPTLNGSEAEAQHILDVITRRVDASTR